ncbi:MAG: TolB family protein [Ktedonobacteraceae bacterium]
MKRYTSRSLLLSLLFLAFILQGCLGIGGNSTPNGTTITTNSNGNQVSVVQNLFKGKIYFTIDHNLWVTDGKNNTREIMTGGNISDPAVSPDGKWIIVSLRFKNSSDIDFIPVSGGTRHTLLSGSGSFYNDSGFIKSSSHWFAQPTWSPDSTHVIFLSDLQKNFVWASLGGDFSNAPFLDLQVFSIPFSNANSKPQDIAYAEFGDGGDRDPSYRPNHPNEIVYTHYAYDTATRTQQVIQIFLEDATAIANHPGAYHPGYDPGVAITDPKVQNIQPAFSPDGNSIVYVRRESPSQMGLYIMPVPNGVTSNPNDPKVMQQALLPYKKSSHILSGLYVSQPVWSPDGKQIAYIAYINNEFDLWLANIAINAKTGQYSLQGNPVQLTTGGIDGNSRPFWTP